MIKVQLPQLRRGKKSIYTLRPLAIEIVSFLFVVIVFELINDYFQMIKNIRRK